MGFLFNILCQGFTFISYFFFPSVIFLTLEIFAHGQFLRVESDSQVCPLDSQSWRVWQSTKSQVEFGTSIEFNCDLGTIAGSCEPPTSQSTMVFIVFYVGGQTASYLGWLCGIFFLYPNYIIFGSQHQGFCLFVVHVGIFYTNTFFYLLLGSNLKFLVGSINHCCISQ